MKRHYNISCDLIFFDDTSSTFKIINKSNKNQVLDIVNIKEINIDKSKAILQKMIEKIMVEAENTDKKFDEIIVYNFDDV